MSCDQEWYAHAKIKSINTEKALAHPGVAAVITGETLKEYNLHMMPTLMSDTQMVLPIEKVCYQAQEVAAVIATDRYSAADGVELVDVMIKKDRKTTIFSTGKLGIKRVPMMSLKRLMLLLKKISICHAFMLHQSKPAVVSQNLIQYPGNLQSG